MQKVLYISLFIPVPAFLKTFYSCHRVSGVLISNVHFLLPGCTLGFGFCVHILIMTSAFHSMHQHTISAFSILVIFLAPKTITNNIIPLGLVNHYLDHSAFFCCTGVCLISASLVFYWYNLILYIYSIKLLFFITLAFILQISSVHAQAQSLAQASWVMTKASQGLTSGLGTYVYKILVLDRVKINLNVL